MLRLFRSLLKGFSTDPHRSDVAKAHAPQSGQAGGAAWSNTRALLAADRIESSVAAYDGQHSSALELFIDAARSEVDPDSELGAQVATIVAQQVNAPTIIDLSRQGQASIAWLHAVFKKLVNLQRLDDAESVIRFVALSDPRNGLYAYRLLDTLRRQHKTGEVVQTIVSGQADVIQVFRFADLFSRLDIDRRHFGSRFREISTVTLLRLLFALRGTDAALELEIRRHLARRRPLSLINAFVEVVRREGKRGVDYPWQEAVEPFESISRHLAAAALIAAHKADGLDPVTLRRGRAALARVRAITDQGPVCSHGWGVYAARSLLHSADAAPPCPLVDRVDVLITFGKTRPGFDDFLSEHPGDIHEIRMAEVPEDEVAGRRTAAISALAADLNAPEVIDCILECRSASKRVASVMCGGGPDPDWLDVVALAIEDRLYPHYKKH